MTGQISLFRTPDSKCSQSMYTRQCGDVVQWWMRGRLPDRYQYQSVTTTRALKPHRMSVKVLSVPDSSTAAAAETKDRLDTTVDERHIANRVADTRWDVPAVSTVDEWHIANRVVDTRWDVPAVSTVDEWHIANRVADTRWDVPAVSTVDDALPLSFTMDYVVQDAGMRPCPDTWKFRVATSSIQESGTSQARKAKIILFLWILMPM